MAGNEDVDEISYHTSWTIKNFAQKSDDQINSKAFEVQTRQIPNTTCTWLIGLHVGLDGRLLYLYCKLCAISGRIGPKILASLQYELLRPNGGSPHVNKETKAVEKNQKMELGIMTKAVYRNWLFADGSLKLKIKLTVSDPNMITPSQIRNNEATAETVASNSLIAIHDNLLALLSNEESSDLKIITSDKVELSGHKLILQMQNPVFASMLRSDMSESKTGIVQVDDVSGKTMRIILRYLYTGDLLPSWSDPDIITEFTYAAGKYQLTEVLKLIDDKLGRDMTSEHNSCILALLSLTSKLSLKNAEERLLEQFCQATANANTAEELFALLDQRNNYSVSLSSPTEATSKKALDSQ